MTAATGHVDLTSLLRALADRDAVRTEADVQSGIATLLQASELNLEDAQVRLETPAPGRRRVDIETGFTVIEVKKNLTVGNVRSEAIDQLRGYVVDRTEHFGQRYAGVLTDGREWVLYHLLQATGELEQVARFDLRTDEPDVEGMLVWLEGVLSTAEQIIPTPIEVQRRLGSDAPGFELDLAELADVYAQCCDEAEVRMKRELWARLLAAAFGRNFANDDRLFIEHTYLVLTAEVIAHAVMGFNVRQGEIGAEELVTGHRFRQVGISGVVEADFFDWPVETGQGCKFVEGLAQRLGRFEWGQVDHDVLKVLYESVIDPATRHSLGEYYTPDWLAERIVEDVVDEPLQQRVLDPACGSGTFVFWAVRRYLAAADDAASTNREAITGVVQHVFGIDLHPVAVTLARVTYLLAIGAERLQDRDPISVPVYLGDSIQFNQSTSVLSAGGITVYTTDGLELFARELNFPEAVVADAGRFDALVDAIASRAGTRLVGGQPPAIGQVMTNYGVTAEADRAMVEQTYNVLCHLHDMGRDHIWGYYVRNLAHPLEFSRPEHRVDRLVGNPPWLRYNAMTAQMQADFRRLTRERHLQAPAQVVTSQDLAGLFVARSVEQYLRVGGRFGFVMPASTLSRLQYRGFRRANFSSPGSVAAVAFDQPWELSGVRPQPFPVPASVAFGSRVDTDQLQPMPEIALWWSANVEDHHRSWGQVADLVTTTEDEVVVAGTDFAAPYAAVARQGSNLVPRVLLCVERAPEAAPLGVPAGQVMVRADRSSPEREPWRELESPTPGVVEEQFVRRMLLGESLLPFRLRGERLVVIPIHDNQVLQPGTFEMEAFPLLNEWWTRAESLYKRHAPDTTTHDLVGQIDYQGKLRAQFPLREHRLVYTGRGERATAARITDPEAVVDHALYWAGFGSRDEVLYAVAVINSAAMHKRILAALSKGLFGGRNIHRAPFLIPWPEFDPTDALHQALARAAETAESVAAGVDPHGGTASARNRVRRALDESEVAEHIEDLVEQLFAQAEADALIEAGQLAPTEPQE